MRPLRGIRFVIDTKIIQNNIQNLRARYSGYDYFMAVVKGQAYGHGLNPQLISAMIDGGADYLVLSYLDEALSVRRQFPEIPILCLTPVSVADIPVCIQNRIDITLANPEFSGEIRHLSCQGLHVHIKLDTGLGRFGLRTEQELLDAMDAVKSCGAEVTGLYTHLVSEEDTDRMLEQIGVFQELTRKIDLSKIPIVHIPNGEAMTHLPKIDFINGVRAGSICYGLMDAAGVKSALSVETEVLFTREFHQGESVGYGGKYTAGQDETLAMLPVGYSDGFFRRYAGHRVFIDGAEYPLVGGVFMCQCYMRCPSDTKPGGKVVLFRDFAHLSRLAHEIGALPEEILLAMKPSEINYK